MKQNRRQFLKTLTLGVIGSGLPEYLLADNSKKYQDGIEIRKGVKIFKEDSQKNLEALAQTIIPSTRHIEIKNIFTNYVASKEYITRYYNSGIIKLNHISKKQYKKSFYKLDTEDQRKTVVKKLEETSPRFFHNCRKMTIKFYYSHPYSWKKLGYNGPPQPVGFMDYYLPPKINT